MRSTVSMKRDLREITHRTIKANAEIELANDRLREAQPGFPASSMGGFGAASLNEAGKPCGLERFVMYPDAASEDLAALDHQIQVARDALRQVHRIVASWASSATVKSDDGTPVVLGPNDDCVACHTLCGIGTGIKKRAGLCDPCHSAWKRWRQTSSGTRHDWLTHRRAYLAELEERAEAG